MNLISPMSTAEPAIAGKGRKDNHHLHDLAELISENLGDHSWHGKESGSTDGATHHKPSNVPEWSQRGRSPQGAGKPRTGGRATACRCFGADFIE
jgi:hypothetical protein